MGAGNFRVSGSAGASPVTSFFGAIPDKFNVLTPAHEDVVNGFKRDTELIAANNINQWTIYNTANTGGANAVTLTLGANTTAPDGTNTAQRIVEAATTSGHYLTAVQPYAVFGPTGPWRLAVFAKAAERTRTVLRVKDGATNTFVKTVFDLAGGQIGVAGTSGNAGSSTAQWVADTIVPFGNGWYCCMVDFIAHFEGGMIAYFELDSGSGTAAESSSYLGDVTKGINVWRATMLPTACWGMSGQVEFFDDFNDNTMSTIDIADTRDPTTKTWFTHQTWPYVFGVIPNGTSNAWSVANSALSIAKVPSGLFSAGQQGMGIGLSTAAWLGPSLGGFIDQGKGALYDLWNSARTYAVGEVKAFAPPDPLRGTSLYISLINGNLNNRPDISPSAWSVYVSDDGAIPGPGYVGKTFSFGLGLYECKNRWANHAGVDNNSNNCWYGTLRGYSGIVQDAANNGHGNNIFGPQALKKYFECETNEVINTQSILNPTSTKFTVNGLDEGGVLVGFANSVAKSYYGYKTWDSLWTFTTNDLAWFNNVLYISTNAANLNNQPDISPGVWSVASDPVAATAPPNAQTKQADFSQYHIYSFLKIPVDRRSGTGMMLHFFDGVFVQPTQGNNRTGLFVYGPQTSNFTRFDLVAPLWGFTDGEQVFMNLQGSNSDYDWVKITR